MRINTIQNYNLQNNNLQNNSKTPAFKQVIIKPNAEVYLESVSTKTLENLYALKEKLAKETNSLFDVLVSNKGITVVKKGETRKSFSFPLTVADAFMQKNPEKEILLRTRYNGVPSELLIKDLEKGEFETISNDIKEMNDYKNFDCVGIAEYLVNLLNKKTISVNVMNKEQEAAQSKRNDLIESLLSDK